jgi:hypothetical protein
VKRRNNCCKRGTHGIHVGPPRHQDSWLVYVPATGGLRTCADVSFDKNFCLTTAHDPAYTSTRFPGSQNGMQMSTQMTPLDDKLEHTGDAWPFASSVGGLADHTDQTATCFAQRGVKELHKQDDRVQSYLIPRSPSHEDSKSSDSGDSNSKHKDDFPTQPDKQDVLVDEDFDELCVKPESRRAQFQPDNVTQEPQDVPQELEAPDSPGDDGDRRSQRSRTTTQRHAPIDHIGFAANRLELQRHAAMHATALRAPLEPLNIPLQIKPKSRTHFQPISAPSPPMTSSPCRVTGNRSCACHPASRTLGPQVSARKCKPCSA